MEGHNDGHTCYSPETMGDHAFTGYPAFPSRGLSKVAHTEDPAAALCSSVAHHEDTEDKGPSLVKTLSVITGPA